MCVILKQPGVHIIPKIADILDPKIFFCPQLFFYFTIRALKFAQGQDS